jgi:biopolymer transport protein ExbD
MTDVVTQNDAELLELESFHEPALLGGGSRDDDVEIDITPMIDITFLMLVFFLVASTPDAQTAVILPPAQHGVAVSQLKSTLFTVGDGGLDLAPLYNADGKLPEFQLSDDVKERNEQIREIVSRAFQDEDKDTVVIKADRSVSFREVARVIKSSSQIEGIKIHLAVLETE